MLLGADGALHYVVTDQAGTPRELLSEDGDRVVWAARFRSWGLLAGEQRLHQNRPANDNRAEDDEARCPIRFQGQWEDGESGLYYNFQRYYDPHTAQYLSPDPIGLAGGSRLQGYVAQPNGWVDPFGLSPCPDALASSRELYNGKGPLTNAGRAATKHPEYFGFRDSNEMQQIYRTPDQIDALADQRVQDALNNGVQTSGAGGRYPDGWVTYTLSDGNAVTFDRNSNFIGFRGPHGS